jgi:alkylhydroperoxidase/carboxymuconolactone decarboxylase family protein YurZ
MSREKENIAVRRRGALAEVRRKRGYVLTYHRLMAELDPALLAAYDAFYTRMTLVGRVLSPAEKETVWLALIVATRARVGTLHFRRAAQAGMSRRAIADAVAIGAVCDSFDAAAFADEAFAEWLPRGGAVEGYLRAFEAARGRVRPALAEIAAAVAHAGRRSGPAMRIHLERAFRHGARREQLAEALSFVLLHCGGPTMLAALDTWLKSAKGGRFPAPYGRRG